MIDYEQWASDIRAVIHITELLTDDIILRCPCCWSLFHYNADHEEPHYEGYGWPSQQVTPNHCPYCNCDYEPMLWQLERELIAILKGKW
ncbi:MAG TPA: hypothetical protein VF077_09445 [Nitrospiraceae bacterium]